MAIRPLETGGCSLSEARAKVFVLYTGGTIGMVPNEEVPGSPLMPGPLDKLLKYASGLGVEEKIHLGFRSFEEPLDSTEVQSEHWLEMAEAIKEVYKEYDGFVILHGTDTMAYTASGLSFICENLAKPIVVTGSQLPISDSRTDAVQNLVSAVHIAGYKAMGIPLIPEVVLCFGDVILRGVRSKKISTSSFDGFDSPNYPHLGTIGDRITIDTRLVREPADNSRQEFSVFSSIDTNVVVVEIFPGFRPNHLDLILREADIKGVILKTFGVGNIPAGHLKFLHEAIEGVGRERNPKMIVNITQCPQGSVEMGHYEASIGLMNMGVTSGLDMTTEAALAKAFWALGTIRDPNQRILRMQINQRGEQSENLFDMRFIDPEDRRQRENDEHDFTVQLPPEFQSNRMTRAMLRFSGVEWNGDGQGRKFRAFINLPPAIDKNSDESNRYLVGEFNESQTGINNDFITDITVLVTQVVDSAISLYVTSDDGPFKLTGANVALFAEV